MSGLCLDRGDDRISRERFIARRRHAVRSDRALLCDGHRSEPAIYRMPRPGKR